MPGNIAVLKLAVQTKTALHVGSQAGMDDVSDSLFRRDTQGRILLPGTSIAGAIRGHLTRLVPAMTQLAPYHICDALIGRKEKTVEGKPAACGCIVCHLMGDIRPLNEFRDEKHKGLSLEELEALNGRASRLIIYDAVLNTSSHIRDGVGIDRTTGASARAASAKFDFESIPAGFPFTVWLELEDANDTDWYLLNLIFYEWQQGRLRFGGNKSRGTGVLLLTDVQIEAYNLDETGQLMNFLRRNNTPPTPQPYSIVIPNRDDSHGTYQAVAGSVQSWLTIDFELQATGFFLANDTTQASARGYDHRSLQWLPGASLRGALRSQAERISRTLVNLDVTSEADFLRRCPASNPFVSFGENQSGLESSAARIRRGREDLRENQEKPLREDASAYDLAEQLFGSVDWGSRLVVEDAPMMNHPIWKKLDFVAIDRFTGGAADGAKFDAVALWQPRFACRLYLEVPERWEIGWLLYTLRDFMDGRVPVGFGAAKGFGEVHLENLRLTLGYAYPEAAPLNDLPAEVNSFFYEAVVTEWEQIAQSGWLEAWHEHLNSFTVKVGHDKSHDPYWNTSIQPLYRKETRINELIK